MVHVGLDFYWFKDGLIGKEVHDLLTPSVIVNTVLKVCTAVDSRCAKILKISENTNSAAYTEMSGCSNRERMVQEEITHRK